MKDTDFVLKSEKVGSAEDLKLIQMEVLVPIASVMRVIAHPLRLKILSFLDSSGSPRRVTDIVDATKDAPQAIVSQHLKVLKDNGLIASQRQGSSIFYRIVSDDCASLLEMVRLAIEEKLL
jgi:DNA-binding transcriptional ArsR family regulator